MPFVQSVPATAVTGVATISITVAAGASLILEVAQTTSGTRTFSATSDVGGAFTSVRQLNNGQVAGILWLPAPAAGTHVISVTTDGSAVAFEAVAIEWSGLDQAATLDGAGGTQRIVTSAFENPSGLTHYCAAFGEIDSVNRSAIICATSLNSTTGGFTAGSALQYVRVNSAANTTRVFFQQRQSLYPTQGERGLYTLTSTARAAVSVMAAFPVPLPVVKKIGTFGTIGVDRDYSTVGAWETDLDNTGVYPTTGLDAYGEMYDDSPFDESFTINGGATPGVGVKVLRPAAGHGHDGTPGTGVRIVCAAARSWSITVADVRIDGIEFHMNGFGAGATAQLNLPGGATLSTILNRLIFHDGAVSASTASERCVISMNGGFGTLQNSLIYNWTVTHTGTGGASGIFWANSTTNQRIVNTTVHNIVRNTGSGTCRGVQTGGNNVCRNVISTQAVGTTSGAKAAFAFNATGGGETHNLSDDASAATNATSAVINAVVADLYVSTVGGAEDLHLKAGAGAIDLGVDLGAQSDDSVIDLNGYDRTSAALPWDIGAYERGAGPAAYQLDALSTSLGLIAKPVVLERTLTNGLPAPLAYWPLNEGSGAMAADASGNGYNAPLNGTTWETALAPFGGSALRNDTLGEGGAITGLALGITHSVSWWLDAYDGVSNGDILNGGGSTYIYFSSGTILRYYVAGTNTLWSDVAPTGLHHWVIVRDGLTITAYKDGVSLGTNTLVGGNNPFSPIFFSCFFGGVIDELRTYDVPLSAAQVGLLYALNPNPTLDALSNSLTITGQAVSLDYVPAAAAYSLDALPASLLITGQAVSLDYVPLVGAYSLDALPTALSLAGRAVSLDLGRRLIAGSRALTISGKAVSLDYVYLSALPPPIAYWPFDAGTGTVAIDAMGNGHDGTLVGATWNAARAKFGGFAAENSAVPVGVSVVPFSLGTVYSVAWWMDGHDVNNGGAIVSNQVTGNPVSMLYFPGQNQFVHLANGGSYANVAAGGDITGSHHWVVTRNGAAFALYRDGVLASTATLTVPTNAFQVTDLLSYFIGVVDDLRLYNVALNATQAELLYALDPTAPPDKVLDALPATLTLAGQNVSLDIGRALNVFPASLLLTGQAVSLDYIPGTPVPIAYWPFNEGSGSTADDVSPGNHVATLVGGTWDLVTPRWGAAALQCNAIGVAATVDSFSLGTVHTIAWWMKGHVDAGSINGLLKDATNDNFVGFLFNNTLSYKASTWGASWNVAGLLTGTHHWVIVRDWLSVTAYRDGVSLGSQPVGSALPFYALDAIGDRFSASLDDLRLYDVPLTDNQVLTLYLLQLDKVLDALPVALSLLGKTVSLELGRVLNVLTNGLTITPAAVGLDRRYVFNVDPVALLLEGLAVGLVFRRSELGWDTALHPPLGACRKSLTAELHPSGDPHPFGSEALQPEVKGAPKTLSDATHPRANVAQPFTLKRKDC